MFNLSTGLNMNFFCSREANFFLNKVFSLKRIVPKNYQSDEKKAYLKTVSHVKFQN